MPRNDSPYSSPSFMDEVLGKKKSRKVKRRDARKSRDNAKFQMLQEHFEGVSDQDELEAEELEHLIQSLSELDSAYE